MCITRSANSCPWPNLEGNGIVCAIDCLALSGSPWSIGVSSLVVR